MTNSFPAASLILWQDGPRPNILMVERSSRMAFAAGAMVFPGGRLDASDWANAPDVREDIETASRIAAIRETIEETGVVVGVEPKPDKERVEKWRGALAEGSTLQELLTLDGYRLTLNQLTAFARWHPPENGGEARIFDTRFYIAKAAQNDDPLPDGRETISAFWCNPSDLLLQADAGRRRIIFPTRRTLERLALFADYDAAYENALAYPVRRIQPWIEERADGPWLRIPGDVGYPVTEEALAGMTRG